MKQWKKEITIKNKEAKIRYIACLAGSVLCLALASYILAGLIVNKQAKTAFEAGQYDEALEKYSSLEEWYLPGKMITKFNQGNCYYGQGEYKKAEAAYREALGYNHMRGEECPSRVNLTLTLLQQVDYEAIETAGDTREDEIIKIKAARKVLCEEGCADAKAGAGGHDEKAVALRNEIDKYLEEQGEKSEEENEDPQEEEENQNQNNSSSSSESNLKDQLDQQKKDAKEERQDTQDQIDNYNKSQEKEK
ncbi:MAG: tetratricopeptide repeat protein, partial [Pseudobutyrivibrio sp.]|nr:tetratricopeptide repeat protein [Pseudobutyrivibrio sp.]